MIIENNCLCLGREQNKFDEQSCFIPLPYLNIGTSSFHLLTIGKYDIVRQIYIIDA